MIHSYGFSIAGSSHIKTGTVCQDANKILPDSGSGSLIIAAIADGVGSCKYAEIAAEIAVKVSVSHCAKGIKSALEKNILLELMENAFLNAEIAIEKKSREDKNPLSEYETTLDLVIFHNKTLYFGHCGDGGIVGLSVNGDYEKLTIPQKVEGIYVVPLRNGSARRNNTWEFKKAEGEYASVLLATDGVYDIFFPYLLKDQPVEIYVPLIRYFMDNNGLKVNKKNIKKLSDERKEFLNSSACESITDDKTIVVLVNEGVFPKILEDTYYEEPDWDALQEIWNRKAYPHLYKKKKGSTKSSKTTDRKKK